MKRSEIVELIAEYMSVLDCCYAGDKHKAAHDLLVSLEDWGMLPPLNSKQYDNVPTVTPTGNYDYSFKRSWEDEE
jgi:hypothetical protein